MSLVLHCPHHGDHYATLICKHLPHGIHLGFFAADAPGDPHPDAWCGACDEVLRIEKGWTDFADWHAGEAVVCAARYDAIKRRNQCNPHEIAPLEVTSPQRVPG